MLLNTFRILSVNREREKRKKRRNVQKKTHMKRLNEQTNENMTKRKTIDLSNVCPVRWHIWVIECMYLMYHSLRHSLSPSLLSIGSFSASVSFYLFRRVRELHLGGHFSTFLCVCVVLIRFHCLSTFSLTSLRMQ